MLMEMIEKKEKKEQENETSEMNGVEEEDSNEEDEKSSEVTNNYNTELLNTITIRLSSREGYKLVSRHQRENLLSEHFEDVN